MTLIIDTKNTSVDPMRVDASPFEIIEEYADQEGISWDDANDYLTNGCGWIFVDENAAEDVSLDCLFG